MIQTFSEQRKYEKCALAEKPLWSSQPSNSYHLPNTDRARANQGSRKHDDPSLFNAQCGMAIENHDSVNVSTLDSALGTESTSKDRTAIS